VTAEPRWTILIATLEQRGNRLQRLLRGLLPQTDRYLGDVRVCALRNRGDRPLADVRQDLIDHAWSTYVSFVDDDDVLPPYHVDEVMEATRLQVVDYVGWQMQAYVDEEPLKPTFHSIRYQGWYDDESGYYRDVSHLNPIRLAVARQATFRDAEPPEDVSWVDRVRPFVRTESYVNRVMYHYYSSPSDTTWRPGSATPGRYDVPVIDHPNFSWHPGSVL
jgi:hypothetical protein